MIGREQPVEAQHRREQRCDPDDPGADPAEQLGLGSDTEREQQHGEHKKREDEPGIAAGWWVAIATLPPAARCSAIRVASRAWPSLSSAALGSSSSQIGAGAAT